MAKGFGVSPITNKIYYGALNKEKNMWTGDKEEVTDDVIRAVFECFIGKMENNVEYSISFPNTDYELVMRRKSAEQRCPLQEVPAKKEGRDVRTWDGYTEHRISDYERGWNACIDEILEGKVKNKNGS